MKYINISIDSMTVLTPIEFFTSIDTSFYDIYLEVNSETSEIVNSSTKPIIHEINGIKIRAFIVNFFGKEYLSVTYNSKYLKTAYFEGLSSNFERAFNYAKSILKFDIEYAKYLTNSIVNDCDFKADFLMDDKDFQQAMTFYSKIHGSKVYYTSFRKFLDERLISGLQFVNRNDASIRSPFVKFYSKFDELESRSRDFKDAYLLNFCEKWYRRLEVTVKNKAHFQSLQVMKRFENPNNLAVILSLQNQHILEIVKELLNKYSTILPEKIKEFEEQPKVKPKSTPTDWLIIESFIILMTENKMSLNNCLALLDDYPALNPNTKSRIRQRLKESFKEITALKSINDIRVSVKDAFL